MTTTTTIDKWIGRRPRSDAQRRLFCLPCAGRGASAYRAWQPDLPPAIDLCPVQLPGRENRLSEAPFTSLAPLASSLAEVIAPHTSIPYALFGHSMGALVAFELARELRRIGAAAPVCLFVAGFAAPDAPRSRERHRLSDPDLVNELHRFGGTPPRLLADAEMMEHVLPLVRADFSVIETYRMREESPLPMPIVGFAGADDEEATPPTMTGWARQTTAGFRLTVFPGDHFFVQAHTVRSALVEAVTRDLFEAQDHAA